MKSLDRAAREYKVCESLTNSRAKTEVLNERKPSARPSVAVWAAANGNAQRATRAPRLNKWSNYTKEGITEKNNTHDLNLMFTASDQTS